MLETLECTTVQVHEQDLERAIYSLYLKLFRADSDSAYEFILAGKQPAVETSWGTTLQSYVTILSTVKVFTGQ